MKNNIPPIIPKTLPIANAPFLPYLSAIQLVISDPVTPPAKNIDTTHDQTNVNCLSVKSMLYSFLILSLQKFFNNFFFFN